MTAPGPDWVEQVRRLAAGLAAEHAAGTRLTDVLGDLLDTPAARPDAASRPEDDGAATRPQPADDCRWCPVCVGLAALRGRRPDLVEALADVLTSAATALRAQAGTQPADSPRTNPDGSVAAPEAPAPDVRTAGAPAPPEETVTHPAPAPAPVQRIDVA
ncbi:hypothetical protein O2V63_06120 [Modestobacter sp. VKM Ac-2977]|uniref:hypothetical protein n=1 Tax=Modestobacter sp. VKM Ac-2977 TaxID=3004131 RepID=UPI0022AA374E|nr:hypothetical protein [Modestobacter sp. VKM Ac-2977]MCZ2819899.1 hypothetical protein [Modestobacter sp. VKM Ac-2977]